VWVLLLIQTINQTQTHAHKMQFRIVVCWLSSGNNDEICDFYIIKVVWPFYDKNIQTILTEGSRMMANGRKD